MKRFTHTAVILALTLKTSPAFAQGTLADYQRAESRLSWNIRKLVFEGEVTPHWIKGTERFWYENVKPDKTEFILVDADKNTQGPVFNHQRLAQALSRATGKNYEANKLPFHTIDFINDGAAISFEIDHAPWQCGLDTLECGKGTATEERRPGLSPDRKWLAEVKQYNLYIKDVSSGEKMQLTNDGEKGWPYATPLPNSRLMVEQRTDEPKQPPAVFWSPDSKMLVTYRIDSRQAGRFTIVQNAPAFQLRPVMYSVVYPLPGEELSKAEPVIFDVAIHKRIAVQTSPIEILFQGGPSFRWMQDSSGFTYRHTDRGYKHMELRAVDAKTGAVRKLLEDKSDTFVDPGTSLQQWFNHDSELLVTSERDGWNHLYLYDAKSGELKNRVTSGDWLVRSIIHVDEPNRQVYFMAGGREPGRDPYLTHLYRINLDGTGMRLLTPEDSNHTVTFSPGGKYFIDVYSRPNVAPTSVLRRCDGTQVRVLERATVDGLSSTGFHFPEPFRGKGRDGQTDIYGIIFRPSNLDTAKKYPVIEQIYSGPQSFFVPKTFSAYRAVPQSLAELGFIVVQIDGMGTGGRSKAFHDHCFKNLGDSGAPDHIALIKQMAAQYPYMDLTRVGVYGTSAGGYDSTHVMLTHPEFYKVAVSTSGVHDNRLDKTWWNELWMSYPVGDWYAQQSNVTLAKNLEGHLLLLHGDLDDNVNVSNTLQLANALIKANKDFDMYIVPNMYHGDSGIMWVMRKRWDYFVQHLLGVRPPKYEIKRPPESELNPDRPQQRRTE